MKEWQEECYLGRHVQFVPAEFAHGYQYRPYADRNMVQRAIQTTGRVEAVSMFDRPAPQLGLWFPFMRKRFWMKRRWSI